MRPQTIRPQAWVYAIAALALAAAPAQAQQEGEHMDPPSDGERAGDEERASDRGQSVKLRPGPLPDSLSGLGVFDQSAPASPEDRQGAPSVLAILSHPDDEIVMAPVLSRIAREGGRVTLVFATSGDAGPGVSDMAPGDELATLREGEGRCAAFALGLDEPIYWRFGDGTLADEARNTQATMRDLGERVAGLIAVEEPTVVMTWGPDGGYGHADHRMTSNAVTQVVQMMGDDRPDLLYAVFPAAPEQNEEEVSLGQQALPGFEGWARVHPSLVTDRIGYELPDLDATIAAVDCYQSQFDEPMRRALASLLHQHVWQGTVTFRLAFVSAS